MRRIAALTAITLFVAMGGSALADGNNGVCRHDHRNQPISAGEMTTKIDRLGYDVRHLKVDDGCFEARIIERDTGGVVEATFSATTGELIRARPVY